MAFDQPLFALAKFVQWKWPVSYGEKKFVVMFGGLHSEMALLNIISDLLEKRMFMFDFLTSNLSSCDFPTGIFVYATSSMLYTCSINNNH